MISLVGVAARKHYSAFGERQQGVALMIVILVFALVSILATGMYNRQSLFVQKASNIGIQTQAYHYALAAETFGLRLLKDDWDTDKEEGKFIDDLEAVQNSIVLPADEAVIEAQFDDVQGKLNINDLVNLDGSVNVLVKERFERLFKRLALESLKVEKLIDWLDDNQDQVDFEGAEDGEYLGLDVPYRTAGMPMVHVSELRLMYGVSEEDYLAILPHVTVLPRGLSHINVNTASAEVLQSLVPNLSDELAEQLVQTRSEGAWENIEEFAAESAFADVQLNRDYIGVNSVFFEIAIRLTLSERIVRLKTLVYRNQSDGSLQVLSRDQGQKYLISKERASLAG